MCESCYYTNDENKMFISTLNGMLPENTMATDTAKMQELMERLDRLEAENRSLKAKATDNIFINSSDNITLKVRSIAPGGWGSPTKNQNGQGYLRSGGFPMGFFFDNEKAPTKLVLHQEIPIDAAQAQLFRERFFLQQMVVAKKRPETGTSQTTPTTPTPTTAPASAPTPTAPPAATGKSFATLPAAEKQALIDEANGLVAAGLFTSLGEALPSVLAGKHITK